MQLIVAILLGALYLRLTQALIGLFPGGGIIIGWFCGPALMMIATGLLGYLICSFLPLRWDDARPYGSPPRNVHLSWRAAVLLPVMLPWVLFPANVIWLSGNSGWDQIGRGWRTFAAVVLAAILAWIIYKVRWERQLLREGEIAMASVNSRDNEELPHQRVFFQFMAADGTVISGWGWDFRYHVAAGDDLPVFYDPRNPKHYIAACGTWFEAD